MKKFTKRIYRQKANPSPEAQERLRQVMAKMRARAAEDCERVRKERLAAERAYWRRLINRI